MSEQLTRLLRVCRGEEKWVLPSGNGEGKREVVSACLHAFRVKIAREQKDREEHRKRERGKWRVCGW